MRLIGTAVCAFGPVIRSRDIPIRGLTFAVCPNCTAGPMHCAACCTRGIAFCTCRNAVGADDSGVRSDRPAGCSRGAGVRTRDTAPGRDCRTHCTACRTGCPRSAALRGRGDAPAQGSRCVVCGPPCHDAVRRCRAMVRRCVVLAPPCRRFTQPCAVLMAQRRALGRRCGVLGPHWPIASRLCSVYGQQSFMRSSPCPCPGAPCLVFRRAAACRVDAVACPLGTGTFGAGTTRRQDDAGP